MKTSIQIYFSDSLIGLKPSSLIAYKTLTDTKFTFFATDKNGARIDLELPISNSVSDVINTDNYLSITGTSIKTINISNTLFVEIKRLIKEDKLLQKVSGENIPSYTPVAIYNNLAYKLDNLKPEHQFAFVGFSVNGTTTGQICKIQQIGELELLNWNLTPNTQYLASASGAIQTSNNSVGFTKVLGYATTANTLQIIKDYTTINK